MKMTIREMTFDELMDSLYSFLNGSDELDENTSCTDNKNKYGYVYNDKKEGPCDSKESDLVKKLRNEIKLRNKEIETLKAQNKEIINNGNKVCENGHKIAEEASIMNRIISDKIMADGYKIVNDIKVWVEFVRKCDRLGAPSFQTMLDMLNKAVSTANDAKK